MSSHKDAKPSHLGKQCLDMISLRCTHHCAILACLLGIDICQRTALCRWGSGPRMSLCMSSHKDAKPSHLGKQCLDMISLRCTHHCAILACLLGIDIFQRTALYRWGSGPCMSLCMSSHKDAKPSHLGKQCLDMIPLQCTHLCAI